MKSDPETIRRLPTALRRLLGSVFMLPVLAACVSAGPDGSVGSTGRLTPTADTFSEDFSVRSRGIQIPVTFAGPQSAPGTAPLVALLHGHGGNRHEAGGFTAVANRLAELGVFTIRMDFAGAGDSSEPFAHNALSNMQEDALAAIQAAKRRAPIDSNRQALLGFSMGARVAAALVEADDRYRALALWAPSATNGIAALVEGFGGAAAFAALKAQAEAEGYAPYETGWGQEQQLGAQWFSDLETSRPADVFAAYPGDLLVLYGDADEVIAPARMHQTAQNAASARSVREVVLPGAPHGLGLFSDDPEMVDRLIRETVDFLAEHLAEP